MQYGFDFGLCTRQIVRELIAQRFGVRLSLASIGAVLVRQGLTPQKPLQRAYRCDCTLAARHVPGDCRHRQAGQGRDLFLGRVWLSCRRGARHDLGCQGPDAGGVGPWSTPEHQRRLGDQFQRGVLVRYLLAGA